MLLLLFPLASCLMVNISIVDFVTDVERRLIAKAALSEISNTLELDDVGTFLSLGPPQINPIMDVMPSEFLYDHLEMMDLCDEEGHYEELLITACLQGIPANLCRNVKGDGWSTRFLEAFVTLSPAPSYAHRLLFAQNVFATHLIPAMLYIAPDDDESMTWSRIIQPYLKQVQDNNALVLAALYNAIPLDPNHSGGREELGLLWLEEWSNTGEFSTWTQPNSLWKIMNENGFPSEYTDTQEWSHYQRGVSQFLDYPWNRSMLASSLCIETGFSNWKQLVPLLTYTGFFRAEEIPCSGAKVLSNLLPLLFIYDNPATKIWFKLEFGLFVRLVENFADHLDSNSSVVTNLVQRLWQHPEVPTLPLGISDHLFTQLEQHLSHPNFANLEEVLVNNFYQHQLFNLPPDPDSRAHFISIILLQPLRHLKDRPNTIANLFRPWLHTGKAFTNILKILRPDVYLPGLLMRMKELLRDDAEFMYTLPHMDLDLLLLIPRERLHLLLRNSSNAVKAEIQLRASVDLKNWMTEDEDDLDIILNNWRL